LITADTRGVKRPLKLVCLSKRPEAVY